MLSCSTCGREVEEFLMPGMTQCSVCYFEGPEASLRAIDEEAMERKVCAGCKETKHLSEFNKDAKRKDGLQTRCKACKRAYAKKYYEEKGDHLKAYQAAWRKKNPHYQRDYREAQRV